LLETNSREVYCRRSRLSPILAWVLWDCAFLLLRTSGKAKDSRVRARGQATERAGDQALHGAIVSPRTIRSSPHGVHKYIKNIWLGQSAFSSAARRSWIISVSRGGLRAPFVLGRGVAVREISTVQQTRTAPLESFNQAVIMTRYELRKGLRGHIFKRMEMRTTKRIGLVIGMTVSLHF